MAARDGIQSIYQIAHTLRNIGSAQRKIPSIEPVVDKTALKSATKEFDRRFANFNDLRNAVSHGAEMTSNPDHFDRNAFVGSFTNDHCKIVDAKRLMLGDTLSQRCFITTRNKKILTYDISDVTLARLKTIQKLVWSAFSETTTVACKFLASLML